MHFDGHTVIILSIKAWSGEGESSVLKTGQKGKVAFFKINC